MPRERSAFSRVSGIRDPSLVVIATEGAKTEQLYFEGVQNKIVEFSSRMRIELLEPRENGHSSPKHVLEQLSAYKRKYGLQPSDELCMVIDRDKQSWTEAELSLVASECSRKQFLLALSNPCFEIWLLLHLEEVIAYSDDRKTELLDNRNSFLKNEIRRILGSYNPSNLNIDDFWELTNAAIERAKSLDLEPQDRWPNGIGSRVHIVLEKIINSLH